MASATSSRFQLRAARGTPHPQSPRARSDLGSPARPLKLLGAAVMFFSALYLLSDVIELGQGGFSSLQLWLTYVAEAAIPLFVIGLYVAQRPSIGRAGLLGALGYAYAYVSSRALSYTR